MTPDRSCATSLCALPAIARGSMIIELHDIEITMGTYLACKARDGPEAPRRSLLSAMAPERPARTPLLLLIAESGRLAGSRARVAAPPRANGGDPHAATHGRTADPTSHLADVSVFVRIFGSLIPSRLTWFVFR